MTDFNDFTYVISHHQEFLDLAKTLPPGDVAAMIEKWKVADLAKIGPGSKAFEDIVEKLDGTAVDVLMRKISPTGAKFKPGEKSRYAVIGVTNMRRRSEFMTLLVAFVSYLYRSLEERSREDSSDIFDVYFDKTQNQIIKSFLDDLFEYNPSKSIDRITSALHKPAALLSAEAKKQKKIKGRTLEASVTEELTMVKDRTRKYGRNENKYKEKYRTVADITFKDVAGEPIEVKVDPPADIYARFFAFYNTHFDGILKTTAALFEEVDGSNRSEKNPYMFEEVFTYVTEEPNTSEAQLISHVRLPRFSLQWQNTVLAISPADGKYFETPEEAHAELLKHKGSTICELLVVPTNAIVLNDSWHEGRRNVITDDSITNSLFQRLEETQKLYTQLNKRRVEDAKLRDIIVNGPDAEDFADYMRELNPAFNQQALDELDEEDLMNAYRDFKAKNIFYQTNDAEFMKFVARQLPGRDLAKHRLTFDEQKKLSVAYQESFDVIELPATAEHIVLDMVEVGGDDPFAAGPRRRREYVPTPDGMTMGKGKGPNGN